MKFSPHSSATRTLLERLVEGDIAKLLAERTRTKAENG